MSPADRAEMWLCGVAGDGYSKTVGIPANLVFVACEQAIACLTKFRKNRTE
jgi:hypothetical protein